MRQDAAKSGIIEFLLKRGFELEGNADDSTTCHLVYQVKPQGVGARIADSIAGELPTAREELMGIPMGLLRERFGDVPKTLNGAKLAMTATGDRYVMPTILDAGRKTIRLSDQGRVFEIKRNRPSGSLVEFADRPVKAKRSESRQKELRKMMDVLHASLSEHVTYEVPFERIPGIDEARVREILKRLLPCRSNRKSRASRKRNQYLCLINNRPSPINYQISESRIK